MHAKESDLFHCPKCRYKCPGKNNLKKHIEVVHDKKINFTCDQCAKGFYEKGQLTNHIKSKILEHSASILKTWSDCILTKNELFDLESNFVSKK